MLKLTIIVLIILIGSSLCSATETALLSVSPIKVQQLAQSQKTSALALWEIKKKINRPIVTVVIINNIFNMVQWRIYKGGKRNNHNNLLYYATGNG